MTKTRYLILALTASVMLGMFGFAACSSDSDVASKNLSKAADNFEIQRRVVFYNGITGDYILEVDGLCAVGNNDSGDKISITCKVGKDKFIKHFLGKSDNVTWFAEQLKSADASTSHYRVVFKPSTVVPDIDFR